MSNATDRSGCIREEVPLASEYATKVYQGFVESFLQNPSIIFDQWKLVRVDMLENIAFEEEYLALRKDFKTREYGVEETVSNYGFLAAANEAPVDLALRQGLRIRMCPINALGHCISGVSLCVHGDVCVQEAATLEVVGQTLDHLILVVFKFMYGRRSPVTPSTGLHIIPPTPGFDSHISTEAPQPNDAIAEQHHRSMVYLYEFENQLFHPRERPRHCCPLAAMYLERRMDAPKISVPRAPQGVPMPTMITNTVPNMGPRHMAPATNKTVMPLMSAGRPGAPGPMNAPMGRSAAPGPMRVAQNQGRGGISQNMNAPLSGAHPYARNQPRASEAEKRRQEEERRMQERKKREEEEKKRKEEERKREEEERKRKEEERRREEERKRREQREAEEKKRQEEQRRKREEEAMERRRREVERERRREEEDRRRKEEERRKREMEDRRQLMVEEERRRRMQEDDDEMMRRRQREREEEFRRQTEEERRQAMMDAQQRQMRIFGGMQQQQQQQVPSLMGSPPIVGFGSGGGGNGRAQMFSGGPVSGGSGTGFGRGFISNNSPTGVPPPMGFRGGPAPQQGGAVGYGLNNMGGNMGRRY